MNGCVDTGELVVIITSIAVAFFLLGLLVAGMRR